MDFAEKTKKFFKNSVFFLVVLLLSCAYIVRSLIDITETGKTVTEIIASGALAAVFGFLISSILSTQGIVSGSKNEKVIKTDILHGETINAISPWQNELDNWCEKETAYELKKKRTAILAQQSISFNDIFGEKPIDITGLAKEKLKCIKRARKAKVKALTASALSSGGIVSKDKYDYGETISQYMAKSNFKQIMSKLICGVIAGYYGVTIIQDTSKALLIWYAIQVVAFVGMGMMKFIKSYFFITEDNRYSKIRKIDTILKFKAEMEKECK